MQFQFTQGFVTQGSVPEIMISSQSCVDGESGSAALHGSSGKLAGPRARPGSNRRICRCGGPSLRRRLSKWRDAERNSPSRCRAPFAAWKFSVLRGPTCRAPAGAWDERTRDRWLPAFRILRDQSSRADGPYFPITPHQRSLEQRGLMVVSVIPRFKSSEALQEPPIRLWLRENLGTCLGISRA